MSCDRKLRPSEARSEARLHDGVPAGARHDLPALRSGCDANIKVPQAERLALQDEVVLVREAVELLKDLWARILFAGGRAVRGKMWVENWWGPRTGGAARTSVAEVSRQNILLCSLRVECGDQAKVEEAQPGSERPAVRKQGRRRA